MQVTRSTTQKLESTAGELRASRARRYAEMLVLMRGLARRYKNMVNRISKAEMNATFIEYEMFQLLKMLEEVSDEAGENFAERTADSRSGEQTKARKPLFYLAESGASLLEIKPRPDGAASVRVDGGKRFTLPPTLAELILRCRFSRNMPPGSLNTCESFIIRHRFPGCGDGAPVGIDGKRIELDALAAVRAGNHGAERRCGCLRPHPA
jgi:hypothetical protein